MSAPAGTVQPEHLPVLNELIVAIAIRQTASGGKPVPIDAELHSDLGVLHLPHVLTPARLFETLPDLVYWGPDRPTEGEPEHCLPVCTRFTEGGTTMLAIADELDWIRQGPWLLPDFDAAAHHRLTTPLARRLYRWLLPRRRSLTQPVELIHLATDLNIVTLDEHRTPVFPPLDQLPGILGPALEELRPWFFETVTLQADLSHYQARLSAAQIRQVQLADEIDAAIDVPF